MASESKAEKYLKRLVIGMIIFVALVGTIAIGIYIAKFGLPSPIDSLGSMGDFGTFGDFVGGLMNPMLQFIVISMLFWSIHIQQSELKETRKELKQSRKANELSASSLQTQAEFQRTQLELTTIEKLLSKLTVEMKVGHDDSLFTGEVSSKHVVDKHAPLDVLMYIDEGNTYLVDNGVNYFIELMKLNGQEALLELTSNSKIKGSIAVERNLNNNIVKQLQLIENYAKEEGSTHFIHFYLSELKPYVLFLQKIQGEGRYECIGDFKETTEYVELCLKEQGKPNHKMISLRESLF